MALITLHPPGTERGRRGLPVGNYLDLSTLHAGSVSSDSELRSVVRLGPGTILATSDSVDNFIRVYRVNGREGSPLPAARLDFDKITLESSFNGKSLNEISEREWLRLNLSERNDFQVGSILLIRTGDDSPKYRYFRVLVQRVENPSDPAASNAFHGNVTTMQFEELISHRIIVPLGIEGFKKGHDFATSEELPTQYITKQTTEIMWSIRPSELDFDGADFYTRNFPVIRVDFRELKGTVDGEPVYFEKPPERPQPWIESVVQESYVSSSYLYTTYRVVIRHNIVLHEYGRRDGTPFESPPDWHKYKYDLYLGDGPKLAFRKYDPPIDVEDEL